MSVEKHPLAGAALPQQTRKRPLKVTKASLARVDRVLRWWEKRLRKRDAA